MILGLRLIQLVTFSFCVLPCVGFLLARVVSDEVDCKLHVGVNVIICLHVLTSDRLATCLACTVCPVGTGSSLQQPCTEVIKEYIVDNSERSLITDCS